MPVAADYRPMSGRSKGHDLTDGTHTRVKIDLFPEYIRPLPPEKRAVWDVVGRALCSETVKQAFVQRLAPGLRRRFGADFAKVGMYPIPILTRDIPGYQIHAASRYALEGDHRPALSAARRCHLAYRHHLPRAAARRQHAQAHADEVLAQYRLRLRGRRGHLAFGRSGRTGGEDPRTRSCSPISSIRGCCGSCVIAASGSATSSRNEIALPTAALRSGDSVALATRELKRS